MKLSIPLQQVSAPHPTRFARPNRSNTPTTNQNLLRHDRFTPDPNDPLNPQYYSDHPIPHFHNPDIARVVAIQAVGLKRRYTRNARRRTDYVLPETWRRILAQSLRVLGVIGTSTVGLVSPINAVKLSRTPATRRVLQQEQGKADAGIIRELLMTDADPNIL